MNVKNLLTTVAIPIFLLGMIWFLLPEAMLASWGAAANDMVIYMSRRYSVLLLGNAVILWLTRSSRQWKRNASFSREVLLAPRSWH
jgi:Na+-driven multidrug efflux pump